MLKRFRIRLIKKYTFDLDGQSEKDIREQVDFIVKHTKILELPELKKTMVVKIKQIHESDYNYEEDN